MRGADRCSFPLARSADMIPQMNAPDPDQSAFDAALQANLAAMRVEVGPDSLGLMYAHYQRLVEANRHVNLTRITSPADAAVKHYADSLSLLAAPWFANRPPSPPLSVLDVGTGAGFPAVPLAIARPHWSITAIDGTNKKVRFVAECAAALGLKNLSTLHARAADLVRQTATPTDSNPWAHRFDLILVRAVGRIEQLLTEAVPLLKRKGAIVFYKTAHLDQEEQSAAVQAARKLHLTSDAHALQLSLGQQILARQLIGYRRI